MEETVFGSLDVHQEAQQERAVLHISASRRLHLRKKTSRCAATRGDESLQQGVDRRDVLLELLLTRDDVHGAWDVPVLRNAFGAGQFLEHAVDGFDEGLSTLV